MREYFESESSISSPDFKWIRMVCMAVFEKNIAGKARCINDTADESQYQTADSQIFEMFYHENPYGLIADFTENYYR